jgi:signal transduction histidine kinase
MLLDNCTTLVRERASRQGLTLSLEIEKGLGDWVADIRKVKQVVINLLSNAVKFTPAGGRVTLRARQVDAGVEIAVIDTGVGIAADQQDLVFEQRFAAHLHHRLRQISQNLFQAGTLAARDDYELHRTIC